MVGTALWRLCPPYEFTSPRTSRRRARRSQHGAALKLRAHILAEIGDRRLQAALAMRHLERVEADLDDAERAQNHRRVDMAHMGDAECLALQIADAHAEHDAAFLLAIVL